MNKHDYITKAAAALESAAGDGRDGRSPSRDVEVYQCAIEIGGTPRVWPTITCTTEEREEFEGDEGLDLGLNPETSLDKETFDKFLAWLKARDLPPIPFGGTTAGPTNPTNPKRVARIRNTMATYVGLLQSSPDDQESNLRDLVSDALHYADAHEVDWANVVDGAVANFRAERGDVIPPYTRSVWWLREGQEICTFGSIEELHAAMEKIMRDAWETRVKALQPTYKRRKDRERASEISKEMTSRFAALGEGRIMELWSIFDDEQGEEEDFGDGYDWGVQEIKVTPKEAAAEAMYAVLGRLVRLHDNSDSAGGDMEVLDDRETWVDAIKTFHSAYTPAKEARK